MYFLSFNLLLLIIKYCSSRQLQLIWNDEFTGHSLDRNKWTPTSFQNYCNLGKVKLCLCNFLHFCIKADGSGLQCYTSDAKNMQIKDGVVILRAIKESYLNRNFT